MFAKKLQFVYETIFYLITIFSGKPVVQESVNEWCFAAVLHAQEDDFDLGLRHTDLVAGVTRVTEVTIV